MHGSTAVKAALLAVLVACSTPDALQPTMLLAQSTGTKPTKPTIVLVHGAFADASGWTGVITQLQQEGYNVVAVQNPLSSLPNDVETTKRLIDAQTGPVVVVAHSYGGAVISGAAAGNPNVKALVYIAALAPDANEVLGPLLNQYPTPALTKFVPDAAGFLHIDYASYPVFFAPDIPRKQAEAMAVAQKPLNAATFTGTNPDAAWQTIPSWFMVAQDDSIISPNLERFFARRMNARITEVKSSHVIFLSHEQTVVKVIREAAGSF